MDVTGDLTGLRPLWVFGYGSLMWDPGFEVAETSIARLADYSRSFCMRSIHHRGTVENPGLVLALDTDTASVCDGLALRVADGQEAATLQYLRERELISSAYLESMVQIDLIGGITVQAVTYIIDRHHAQYCGGLPFDEQARIIAEATGGRGPNHEYLTNTADHLAELGIKDDDLARLSARVAGLRGG